MTSADFMPWRGMLQKLAPISDRVASSAFALELWISNG
jgi:hypothetical protein